MANNNNTTPSTLLMSGRTQMMLGNRVMMTWNPTTKQFEQMNRPGIAQGPTGEKVFRFSHSKLY